MEHYERSLLHEDFFTESSTEVLDRGTSHAIQVGDLAGLVYRNSRTNTGKMLVDYSIKNPSTSVERIKAKQEALAEIRANDNIREGIEDVLTRVREHEEDATGFLYPDWFSEPYDKQGKIRTILTSLPEWAQDIPEPESEYLRELKDNISGNLRNSPVHKLAKGPIFRHLIKSKVYGLEELLKNPSLVSPLPFHPLPLQIIPSIMGLGAPLTAGIYYLSTGEIPQDEQAGILIVSVVASAIGSAMGFAIGRMRDAYNFLDPMRKQFRDETEAVRTYETIGRLDELLAYDKFRGQLPHSSLPEVSDSEIHEFFAEDLVNPLQSQRIEDYVPNDVVLNNGQRLTFLTGPNSGGKTSLGKSIVQAQVLAQAGCYVPASNARISISDKVFYQVGGNDSLDDDEGGLGKQFKETKNVLFSSTPRSLVIIDDLIEGTTFDEKTRHTTDQLYGFLHKGANTVYTSHHFELAKRFKDRGIGNFWQVEFDGEKPTHRIIPGISSNSHSDVVAKRIGFDKEAITQHLVEEGYLKPGQDLRGFEYN